MIGVTLQNRSLKLNRHKKDYVTQQTLLKYRLLLISSVMSFFFFFNLSVAMFNVSRKTVLLIMEIKAASRNLLGSDHYQIITGNDFPLVFVNLSWGLYAHLNSFCVSVDTYEVLDQLHSNCQALCL